MGMRVSPAVSDRTTGHVVSVKGVSRVSASIAIFPRLAFLLKKRAGGFLSRWTQSTGLRANGGVCFDNELDVRLQFIDHAMSLQLISSFLQSLVLNEAYC